MLTLHCLHSLTVDPNNNETLQPIMVMDPNIIETVTCFQLPAAFPEHYKSKSSLTCK